MAYQARRKQHFVENLELIDESGKVAHTISVDLDPGEVAEKLSKKYMELLQAQKLANSVNTNDMEAMVNAYTKLGDSVKAIMESVFGEEDSKIILEFYDNRPSEMITEILPFITDVVIPNVRRQAQDMRKNALQSYSRKQRRMFGRLS